MKIRNELRQTEAHEEDITIRSLGVRIRAKRVSALKHASHKQSSWIERMFEDVVEAHI